ncbi:uncharacterized protein [Procambarus clarkii]|uniref:uncharacterized protein n=1 Tax=Procambarus clarkii TaxID=6728 RepID=UPI0037432671
MKRVLSMAPWSHCSHNSTNSRSQNSSNGVNRNNILKIRGSISISKSDISVKRGSLSARKGSISARRGSLSARRGNISARRGSISARRARVSVNNTQTSIASMGLLVVVVVALATFGAGSELPDRECCDSAPPPPPHYHTVTSTTTTTTPQPPTYGSGHEQQQEHQTLNCLLAKQLCDEDTNCSAILKVLPTLCGPELVACSTVTVSRCQAALRTLVQFPWFQPTCLCREPRLDPQCNAFRDLVFDHPCVFVTRKEVDMHPLSYIPNCEEAADICRNNPWCMQRFDLFRDTCKFREGQCRNPDREDCLKAWLQLRETPLLGCICPDGLDKKCSRLYSLVNENPCVGESYPGRVALMSRVSAALGTQLTRPVPVPTAAATLLIISSSHAAEPFYPLSTIHHFHQHLPVSKSDHNVSLEQLKHVAGTCHSALEDCMADSGCRSHLEMVSSHCDTAYCHKDACRSSIQDIYKFLLETNQDLALKIALCVCSDRSQTRCVQGQRRLHPPCARLSQSVSDSQCHNLGRDCRSDRVCRYRLEHYELSCAADTMTGRCAGQHQECTKAMLGLLGTDLHTNCVCKGSAFQDINQCLAWKRLLWGNPCVVESQLTYHLAHLGLDADILVSSFTDDHHQQVDPHDQAGEKGPSPQYAVGRGDGYNDHESPDDQNDADAELIQVDDSRLQARKVGSTAQSDPTLPQVDLASPPSTTTTSTTTTATTTLPEKYCLVKRAWEPSAHVIEAGSSIRLYKEGDEDCSELCFCDNDQQTKCKVLDCLESRPCETTFAVYNHNAPAYQMSRGACLCYSGDFICQRPRPEEYDLPTGLFLLVGFSRTEEALLRNVTGGSAIDALIPLQLIFRTISADMGEECRLEVFQQTVGNLVLQVRHYQVSSGVTNTTYSRYMMQEERNRCEKPVTKVAEMINKRAPRILHDVRLSLFVLAEVIDNVPSPQRISGGLPGPRSVGVRACWWAWVTGAALALAGKLHTGDWGVAIL